MDIADNLKSLITEFDKHGTSPDENPKNVDLLEEFLKKFPPESLKTIKLEDYALGLPNSKDSFCYWLETKLSVFGNIKGGGTAVKFSVYNGKQGEDKTKELRWAKWTNGSFFMIQNELNELISAGRARNLEMINKNKLTQIFKGKILATYFPESYLNVFSYNHVKKFLRYFNINNFPPLEEAKQKLITIKNSDKIMRNWSNIKFVSFLYSLQDNLERD